MRIIRKIGGGDLPRSPYTRPELERVEFFVELGFALSNKEREDDIEGLEEDEYEDFD